MEPENKHSVVTRCNWKLSLKKHWVTTCLWIAKSKHCQHLLGWLGCWIPKLVSSVHHPKNTLSETLCFSVRRGEGVFLSRHFDSPQQECQTDLPFYRAFVVYLLLKALWATFTHSPTRSYSDGRDGEARGHTALSKVPYEISLLSPPHTHSHTDGAAVTSKAQV